MRRRLDHMNVLGDTLEEIALDKAGIFKPGVPALIGKSCPVELLKVGGVAPKISGGGIFAPLTDGNCAII